MTRIDGYTETGAAGGDLVYPSHTASVTIVRAGAELSTTINRLTPSIRAAYNHVVSPDTQLLNVSLNGVLSPLATQSVVVPRFNSHSATVGLGLQGDVTPTIGWRVGYDANIATRGGGAVSHGVIAGLRIGL